MQKRFCTLLSGAVLLIALENSLEAAENKIQTFVNAKGKLVFTNLVDNTPAPVAPVIQEVRDPLIDEMPAEYRSLVDNISTSHNVDPALVRAVMKTESNFNRWAVSHKGALGLMQLIPATGRRFGVVDFHDPIQNIQGGVRYLKFLLDKFNWNLDLTLAAYNAGENLVARLGRIPAIQETSNYVKKVRAIYRKSSTLPPNPVQAVQAAAAVQASKPPEDSRQLYRYVDNRGVVHFSNVGPPNR